MKFGAWGTAAVVSCACVVAQGKPSKEVVEQDKHIHLNQIQVIGTHNSYNLGFAPSEAKFLQRKNPKAYASLEYAHKPLASQLDGGVRQLEIDVYTDPKGGKFSHPKIIELTKQAGLPADPDFDPKHEMDKPGIKTIHVQDLNQRSSCPLFTECLTQVRDWSKAHPQHVPLFLLIETKKGKSPVPAAPMRGNGLRKTSTHSIKKFGVSFRTEMVLPDDVRGSYPTLEKAVLAGNWPLLEKSRGKVIFVMDQRDVSPVYTAGHPSLKGRVIFTNSRPGEPDAAFIEMNGGTAAEIDANVKLGYIIRARADDSTRAARDNDTARRDELLHSGATMISTDYPLSEPAKWSGSYTVGFPAGLPARCNLVNAPAGCKTELLEPGAKSGGTPSEVHHPVKE